MVGLKGYLKILAVSGFLVGIGITGVPATHAQNTTTPSEIVQTIENSRARDAFWSVIVRDSTGSILEGYNYDKLIRPASNLKLLTSAAILSTLGPGYTFQTNMYGIGYQEGRTWRGDIVIRGTGDPSISGRFYNEHRFYVYEKFVSALDSMGISRIEGNLIGNDSFFDSQPYPKGWSWEDLTFYYGVEISALSFNNNAVDLEVFADKEVGETPRIQWFPFDTDYVEFVNEQVITPPDTEYDEFYRRILGTNTIILRSKLPQGYYEDEPLSVMNASLYFMDTFKKYLEDSGIEAAGRIIIDDQPKDWGSDQYSVLASHESKPLGTLVREINKESSNFYTEMLLKAASVEQFGTQGSTELGLTLVGEYAHSIGLDTTRIHMNDGSGMAPSTLLTSEDLSKLLVNMQDHPYFDIYRSSFPVAGVDGLLEHRFRGTPLRGNLFGKTGYVSGVRALSGYMNASSGQRLIFSIITNHYTEETAYIDFVQETILKQLYQRY